MLTEDFGDLTNVDRLMTHVVQHIEKVSVLIQNGADPSHAVKVLLANARFTQQQFRDQYAAKDRERAGGASAESVSVFRDAAVVARDSDSDHARVADRHAHVGNGCALDYRGRYCETCDDD